MVATTVKDMTGLVMFISYIWILLWSLIHGVHDWSQKKTNDRDIDAGSGAGLGRGGYTWISDTSRSTVSREQYSCNYDYNWRDLRFLDMYPHSLPEHRTRRRCMWRGRQLEHWFLQNWVFLLSLNWTNLSTQGTIQPANSSFWIKEYWNQGNFSCIQIPSRN